MSLACICDFLLLPLHCQFENITMEKFDLPENLSNIWPSELLVLLGLWLIKKGEYGHGLLCIHGVSLGMKIGDQLELKWKHIVDDGRVGNFVKYDDGKMKERHISDFFNDATTQVYHELKIGKKTNTSLYVNPKTDKPLTTSTLNRELAKFSAEFLEYIFESTGYSLFMKDLKSNAFEIAWGRDMVNKYTRTKKVFQAVNRYMGHRQMSDTYELLGLNPIDEIHFDFNISKPIYSLDLFESKQKGKKKLRSAILDLKLLFTKGGDDYSEDVQMEHLRKVK